MPVDTIAACCTPPGAGARAVVRLSGPRAWDLAGTLLELGDPLRTGRALAAHLPLGGGARLPVMLLAFAAPRSLTGEDVVEVHLPGWPAVVAELLRRLVEAGARPARRGEFARRAVVSGRLDLSGALAVARLVQAEDDEECQRAAEALAGAPAALHARLRDELLGALARLEAHVDFEEEDTEAIGEAELSAALRRALDLARDLARVAGRQAPRDGVTDVVLLGPPNAGKSSLFTRLCPGAQALVSPVPGTTRDMLEATVEHEGRVFRVLDGPGVDGEASGLSPLDRAAMQLFLGQLPEHALVLHVHDATAPAAPAARAARLAAAAGRTVLEVANKIDLLAAAARGGETGVPAPGRACVAVSALTGEGVPALWRALAAHAPPARAADLATGSAAEAAAAIVPLLEDALAQDLAAALPVVALGLRDALQRLASADDDARRLDDELLDRIFSSFCIGK